LNHQMQVSGGHLLAASLDGGNSLMSQIPSPPPKIPIPPVGYGYFYRRRDLKGRPDRREGKQVSGGHLLSPWENP